MSPLTMCPECGPNVAIDEDGCCVTCGATATGAWTERRRELDEITRARHEAEDIVRQVEAALAREQEIERRIRDRIEELEKELHVTRLDLETQIANVDGRYDEIGPAREALAALSDRDNALGHGRTP